MSKEPNEPLEYEEFWLPSTVSRHDPSIPIATDVQRREAYIQMMQTIAEAKAERARREAERPS